MTAAVHVPNAQLDASQPEQPFLTSLFDRLNENGLSYCVLRDHESLPNSTAGHDIDLLVATKDLDDAARIVRETAANHGGKVIAGYRQAGIILRLCGRDNAWWGVALDLFPTLSYRGLPIFDTNVILDRATSCRGIAVASAGDSLVTSFLKECLHNGRDRKDYLRQAAEHFNAADSDYAEQLLPFFGADVVDEIRTIFAREQATEPAVRALGKLARRGLWRTALRQGPASAVGRRGASQWGRLRRILRRPGISVAILGPDGVGKSTILQAVQPVLERALHGAVRVAHLRPNLLPSLADLFSPSGAKEVVGPVSDPHGRRADGPLRSLLRIGYYSLDYILGFWLKVFPSLVRRPQVWLFDRYFQDYYVDPTRTRVSLPAWVVRVIGLAVPTPDLILCLGAEPQRIRERKPELPLQELTRQIERLQALCDATPGAVWIDTGGGVDDARDRALEAIVARMADRCA